MKTAFFSNQTCVLFSADQKYFFCLNDWQLVLVHIFALDRATYKSQQKTIAHLANTHLNDLMKDCSNKDNRLFRPEPL